MNSPVLVKTNRDVRFLKEVYKYAWTDLFNVEDELPARAVFIRWEPRGVWGLWRLRKDRVEIPLGVYKSLIDAAYWARKESNV